MDNSLFPEDEILEEKEEEKEGNPEEGGTEDEKVEEAQAEPEFDSPIPEASQLTQEEVDELPADVQVFLQLPPDKQAAWIEEHGASGIIKAIQAVKVQAQMELKQKLEEERRHMLVNVVEEWKADHEDIANDPILLAMAKGIDEVLLAKKGYKSYSQLNPVQLRRHLDAVAETIYAKIKKAEKKPEPSGNEVSTTDVPKSLGDISGKADEGGVNVEAMSAIDLENLVQKMDESELEKLIMQ